MQSLSRRARRTHCRCISSLLTVAPLEQRTLGFSKISHKITKKPIWELVPLLRHPDRHDPALRDTLQRSGVSPDEWARWSPVVCSPTFERAVDILHRNHAEYKSHQTPSWVVLALASHKIRSPSDAQSALYDLVFPLTSIPSPRPPIDKFHALPLFVLTAHSIAYFSLISLLRPLTLHLIDLPPNSHIYKSFHFNMLLQAVSLFDRSRAAANVAVDVLREMENRSLIVWPDTERVLIRDNFRSPQLLDYFRRRGSIPANMERSGAWLRAYASLGNVQSSAYYFNTIRKQCLENGVAPPYTTEEDMDANDRDLEGTAHKANTQYLRSMRHDRQSAFRYFHHLLKLDLSKSRNSASPSSQPNATHKSNIDIYDWTTALHAGARDRTLSASSLLDLLKATKEGTSAYQPTRATYIVLIQGLMRRNALDEAEKLWDVFVNEVVGARGKGNVENEMRMDRKALCVGIDVLVQSGRAEEALYLLEEAVKRDIEEVATSSPTPSSSPQSKPIRTLISPYLKVHPIHILFTSLLRIRRPDAIFYIWTHLTSLYFVPPTNLMLRVLLKAAMQASKIDGESIKGAMSWYIVDNRLFKKQDGPIAPTMVPYNTTMHSRHQDYDDKEESDHISKHTPSSSRDVLVAHLSSLFQSPSPPVVGIWANRRSTEVARSIFRGMMFGNWPALGRATGSFGSGVTPARAKGGDSILQEFARVLMPDPGRFMRHPADLGAERPGTTQRAGEQVGPPLPTIVPSESTFAAYIALLGLSSRAEEIPEVLVWMQALGVMPKTETLAVALVFWMEVGLRGPLFEDGWGMRQGVDVRTGDSPTANDALPRTEYGALRTWIRAWVGDRAPTEDDIYAGIKRVKEMRDGRVLVSKATYTHRN